MKKILVIGGGFAGLWSAAAAARMAELLDKNVDITLVNPDSYHSIRVRNYEDDLADTLVPLEPVLRPIGVALTVGTVTQIDHVRQSVNVDMAGHKRDLSYDKLILASGSHLTRPPVPGAADHSFDVDTHAAATRLQLHISELAKMAPRPGRFTAVVVGSGATGVELACELPARLRAAALASGDSTALDEVRVVVVDSGKKIAGHLGGAQEVIEEACLEIGIELLPNRSIVAMDAYGVTLSDGAHLPATTVVWCAGMNASNLTATFPVSRDPAGRLFVDPFMRVDGIQHVFAAGDVAHSLIDGVHPSVMSCQHARPMGRYAGHNAVCDLFGHEMLALYIDWYTNIIDLGPWGAVYSQGWDRQVVARGMAAKTTKQIINRERIYPPRTGDRAQILGAAGPDLQRPPVLKALSDNVPSEEANGS